MSDTGMLSSKEEIEGQAQHQRGGAVLVELEKKLKPWGYWPLTMPLEAFTRSEDVQHGGCWALSHTGAGHVKDATGLRDAQHFAVQPGEKDHAHWRRMSHQRVKQ